MADERDLEHGRGAGFGHSITLREEPSGAGGDVPIDPRGKEGVKRPDGKRHYQLCQTMAYAHSRGVIHRDLKPGNVMVGAFGEVQVVDWGLAKVMPRGGGEEEQRASLMRQLQQASVIQTVRSAPETASYSLAGSVFGTPSYMPPEQARGEVARLDERADVFSLGAILCEVLTGAPPYPGSSEQALERAANADLDDAHQRLDDCGADQELVAMAKRCLAPAPTARPKDAAALANYHKPSAPDGRVHRLLVLAHPIEKKRES